MIRPHHIRLVAAFEIRPPGASARMVFERDEIERLGGCIAEDLSALVDDVTRGHLIVGPALLEPAQLVNPEFAPWSAMKNLAALPAGFEPGVTSIGAHAGRTPGDALLPRRERPEGLFLCLPLLLAAAPDDAGNLSETFERLLFEQGGLRPPALGELAGFSGLEPVHGQLMTEADLLALFKVQLAGAGLDPFWPPVEHAVLAPEQPARMELPGGVAARWDPDSRAWELAFIGYDEAEGDAESWMLWLRGLRQTAAMLESCLVRWRPVAEAPSTVVDDSGRWAERRLAPDDRHGLAWRIEDQAMGLVGYAAVLDGTRRALYPLSIDAVADLENHLHSQGVAEPSGSDALELLSVER
jgi:hypothetical protein